MSCWVLLHNLWAKRGDFDLNCEIIHWNLSGIWIYTNFKVFKVVGAPCGTLSLLVSAILRIGLFIPLLRPESDREDVQEHMRAHAKPFSMTEIVFVCVCVCVSAKCFQSGRHLTSLCPRLGVPVTFYCFCPGVKHAVAVEQKDFSPVTQSSQPVLFYLPCLCPSSWIKP